MKDMHTKSYFFIVGLVIVFLGAYMESIMLTDIVFAVVFACQIYLLSIYVPRKLMAGHFDEFPKWRQALKTSLVYNKANKALVVVGLSLLLAFFLVDALAVMTPALLTVAGFFFFQMTPLAFVVGPALVKATKVEPVPDFSAAVRLADFVSPLALALAAVLIVGYLGMQLILWDGTWSKQMLQIFIYSAFQLFAGCTLTWQLWVSKHAGPQERTERIKALATMAPLFTLLSIGISVYYFGKDILFVLDLHVLRPAMMSFFLQLLALLSIHHILRPWPGKSLQPNSSAAVER